MGQSIKIRGETVSVNTILSIPLSHGLVSVSFFRSWLMNIRLMRRWLQVFVGNHAALPHMGGNQWQISVNGSEISGKWGVNGSV